MKPYPAWEELVWRDGEEGSVPYAIVQLPKHHLDVRKLRGGDFWFYVEPGHEVRHKIGKSVVNVAVRASEGELLLRCTYYELLRKYGASDAV